MKVAVTTDTNSGICTEEAEKLGIFLLPMPVIIDGEGYLEAVSIDSSALYDAMARDADISTSQPSPGAVIALWESIFARGYEKIVHIPMTSGLSGSYQSASILAQDYDGRVQVVDNRRISVTQRVAVMEAKAMVDAGASAEEIREYLEDTALCASIYLSVDSLKFLQKGGRLSSSTALVGTLLNIKPVLTIQGEKIDALAKTRGMKAAQRKLIELLAEDVKTRFADVPCEKLRIMTAGTLTTAQECEAWRAAVQEEFPTHNVIYDPLPCSIATHLGPNAVGIALAVSEK